MWGIGEQWKEGTGWKMVKGLAKEYIGITHEQRQQSKDCLKKEGQGQEKVGKGGEIGAAIIFSTIKTNKKEFVWRE